ncbi:thioredoxin F, chloroplastic-like [Dendrobium catenatum]|uniref:Thioredoxin F, chloroplastic n=1 Tax=Dendrobium catenatum TaxID=906689 RepID=A0A2I0XJ32_9ASPA|nr:thioredoxin F, chloroplastic-like [Dendrobium catenatum]PKU87922.1 Thioredoxin F, chloroplastic [Dendrobium catenatum]
MALRISVSPSGSLRSSTSHPSPAVAAWCPQQRLLPADSGRRTAGMMSRDGRRGLRVSPVRSSLEMVEPTVGQVTEVNKDTFWPIVKAAEPKIVVLDMYTQWCGPCKIIAPKFKELSEKYLDVVFLKLDCNQDNKALAKELGIKVVPTFKVLKGSKVVKEVTGAKLDDIILAIETTKSS